MIFKNEIKINSWQLLVKEIKNKLLMQTFRTTKIIL